jgi:hypothetical protein
MSKHSEMEDIFGSYEWCIIERLEQLDWMARKLYHEMGIFGISQKIAEPFVKNRMAALIEQVTKKGDEDFAQHFQLRRGKRKY